MKILDLEFVPYISQTQIQVKVNELSARITVDFKDKDPLFIILLNGAFLFAADLVKEIATPCNLSFIKVASYSGTESRGKVDKLIGLNEKINNRNLIIIDDIIDTGLTMQGVIDELQKQNPASISVASLLYKPDAFLGKFTPKYIGFEIPNDFVVGYGLDYNGYGRNLKEILKIKE